MDIIWHRSDLRVADNTALAKAETIVPVYVFDPKIIEHGSARRLAWLIENVRWLRDRYRELGADMHVVVGEPLDELPTLVDQYDADRVLWNKSYSRLGRSRDEQVEKQLSVTTKSFHDKGLHDPTTIFTNDGDPYSVFTYYHKKWRDREKQEPYDIPNTFADVAQGQQIPSVTDFDFEEPDIELPEPGTDAARQRLDTFIDTAIAAYDERRDYPDEPNTSRLSPYLSYGSIGVREVWAKTKQAERKQRMAIDSIRSYQEQLAWRDFYTQVLYHNPSVVTENYKEYERPIEWRENDVDLVAWQNGETGYPIVDAGMRQLIEEGWMHNRVRMIVASFLTKDLLIDWRHGYAWFRKLLIDHDTANNNGGWQWAASTGTDAQPYFRIFNPMTQGKRYDPDAEYIKEYVPELRGVDADTIHSWHELSNAERSEIAPDYPHPIVDHSEMRERAIEMFEAARGNE